MGVTPSYLTAEQQAGQLINATSAGDAGARSDHFNGVALAAAWTTVGSNAFSLTQVKNSTLILKSGSVQAQLLQAYTPSGAFTIECRFRAYNISTQTGVCFALLARDNNSGNAANGEGVAASMINSGGLFGFAAGRLDLASLDAGVATSRANIVGPNGGANVAQEMMPWVYCKLARNGSNTWTASWSMDRNYWHDTGTYAKTFTVAQVGFSVSGNSGEVHQIDFFDVTV